MSTYYFYIGSDGRRQEIGRATSINRYCWDCHLILGDQVACPQCGKRESPFDLYRGPAIEQGLAPERQQRPTGVTSAECFQWEVARRHAAVRSMLKKDEPIIEREDGQRYTGPQFQAMLLANCPIESVAE